MCDPLTAIMVTSQVVKGAGAVKQGQQEAKLAGRRAGQIQFDTEQKLEQTKQRQDRRRGATRAAFAKGGVKVKGTAAKLIEEQIKQDEIELLKIKHGGAVAEQAEYQKARSAVARGGQGLFKAGAGLFDILDKSKTLAN